MANLEKELTELINQLEEQNKIAEQLNKEAAALEARKKVLEEQFLDGVQTVEKALGKKIKKSTVKKTLEAFMVEAEKVKTEVEKKILHQKKVIELIQDEKYDEAEALMGNAEGVVSFEDEKIEETPVDEFDEVDTVVSTLESKCSGEIVLDLDEEEFDLEKENAESKNENSSQGIDLEETWSDEEEDSDDSFSLNDDDDDFDFSDLVTGTKFSL